MTMRRTGTWVLVLMSVLVFAGVAYAGNGNGNGNGKGTEGGSPENSADPLGQVKKDAPPPAVETTTVATAPTTTAAAASSAPANSLGVKPSNETAHDTHAEAQSDTTTQTTTTEQKPPQSEPGSKPVQGESSGGVATSAEQDGDNQGVLPATQRIGHAATLPFTGQRLWLVALLGVILIATGLALREIRTAAAPVESGHDHTDRSRHAARSTGAS